MVSVDILYAVYCTDGLYVYEALFPYELLLLLQFFANKFRCIYTKYYTIKVVTSSFLALKIQIKYPNRLDKNSYQFLKKRSM